ncbi:MAG: formate--tetrahydrofolate ligase [Thermodesulfobacteriota bacterium]|nr:formate--tetrahydrofolate ligase [Thermodesulfobacteriota bacterium]
MNPDIEIAQNAHIRPITEVAASIGIEADELIPYGRYMAKVPLDISKRLKDVPDGKLILVTAMTPTPKGEGKTTTTIGLSQAISAIGKKAMIAIREPSLGPCMGIKGGAAGGGYSQVLPMEDINLHFTGDLHAVSSANNLLSAIIDNHLHQKATPQIDPRNIVWKRVIDMNDRTLRSIILGLEGNGKNGVMREDGFQITAASEIMAILCLAEGLDDLKQRVAGIIAGYDFLGKPVRVSDIHAQGAMTSLLKHAIHPNLVQSIEGVPAFVHGGPFANIAHGCNTLVATRMALKLSDYTVTEAGFGADLGAEKFFDIKCRYGGLNPAAIVLVVTKRAFVLHGIENVAKHVDTIGRFGLSPVISINRFLDDSLQDLEDIRMQCEALGVPAFITDYRESGGKGGLDLAEKVVEMSEAPSAFKMLYDLDMGICDKVITIARGAYGVGGVEFSAEALKEIKHLEDLGYGRLPVCMAKTPASLTDNPKIKGGPNPGHKIHVKMARVSAGAGFIVVYTGKVLTMPGLPSHPVALDIDIDHDGKISGLF